MAQDDTLINKSISNLVEYEFPEFFRSDGPLFVAFVKKYYEWLEGKSRKAVPQTKGTVKVTAQGKTVTGTRTFFLDLFQAGDFIAIYDNDGDYSNYEIASVDSDTQITLVDGCEFSGTGMKYGTTIVAPNTIYHSRRLFDYDDIDNTADEFIIYFKEKYLKNIQFETQTKTRQLVKHALDIYRSKGTERSADLLFRLVFGTGASFYYPGSDLFKTSDGVWYVPKYLEISLNEQTEKFVNKEIIGLNTGATAFAESLIRRTVKDKIIDVLYISAINGNFETGEVINTRDYVIANSAAPRIIGSLTELEVDVDGASELYSVGDIVDISSNTGEQGTARVTSVSDIVGLVNFQPSNTGYGFSANANVYVSEQVLVLSNVVANSYQQYFGLFEGISQPLANIAYAAANGDFANGDSVFTYDGDDEELGEGVVLSVATTNSTAGTLLVRPLSGNLNSDNLYTDSNTIAANISTYTDVTAIGNVIGVSSNVTLKTTNLVGQFQVGEEIYQVANVDGVSNTKSVNASMNSYVSIVGANGSMTLVNASATAFLTNTTIYGMQSNAQATVESVALSIGYVNGNNSFTALANNYLEGNTFGTNATIVSISNGSGASFSISNNFLFSEDVELNTDIIEDYKTVAINATSYGFPGMPTGNLSSKISDILTFTTFTIGRPKSLTNINKGQGYNIPPFALVYEPLTAQYKKPERVKLTVDTNAFYVGEMVTQEDVDSRGVIVASSGQELIVDNLRIQSAKDFILSEEDANNALVGALSGFSANITAVEPINPETTFGIMGANFKLTASTQTSKGAVTGLKPIDSGFGFEQDQQVTFSKDGLEPGKAFAKLLTSGKASGRYRKLGSTPSSNKRLYDGYYWQDYSYEVRSSLMLSKYEDMLKQLLHVSGTKYFGAFVKQTSFDAEISSDKTIITAS